MKKLLFKNLVFLARQETCPQVNVVEEVMYRLSSITVRRTDPYRIYTWVGSISGAMAACILIAISLFWHSNSDSISEIMTYVSWVTQ